MSDEKKALDKALASFGRVVAVAKEIKQEEKAPPSETKTTSKG